MSEIEQTKRAVDCCQKILNRYDPENDTYPNGPRVTWAEFYLADAVKLLADAVDELAALKVEKRKKSKWHPQVERPMKSKKFESCSVEVFAEVGDRFEFIYWNNSIKAWVQANWIINNVKRWRYLKKSERKWRDWQGEPWPDEGGEE